MSIDIRVEDMTLEELADYATMRIHLALLQEGGKGMKSEVYLWLSQAIIWSNVNRIKIKNRK